MATKLNEKDEKFIQYWENSIKLGRIPYSLINGLLAGIVLFVLANIAYYIFTSETFLHLDRDSILSGIICYIIGFLFFYIPVWNVNSFKYHVILKKRTKSKKK